MKTIPNIPVQQMDHKAFRIVNTDDDGEAIWKDAEKTEPELVPGDVKDVMQIALLNIPRSIQLGQDDLRVRQMWTQLDACPDGTVNLRDKTYNWFHRLLNREVPLTKEQKEQGVKEQRQYAVILFGYFNSHYIVEQLTDIDERKPFEELEEDEQEKVGSASESNEDD